VESEFAANVRKSAEASFADGFYCAESVLLALAEALGIESPLLPKIATAFCSGIGRTCNICGALSGAIMGVSLAFGRSDAGASLQPAYSATNQLIKDFEQEFGARECHVLLGCDLASHEGQKQFREKRLFKRCAKFTGRAAEIAAHIINEKKV